MGSLLIPLLGRMAAKAADALVAELLRAWGLDKARRKLERHLAEVQCILLDADAKSRTNPAVRQWVNDLKTAAYQADDVLDGFRYEALRRRAAAQIRRPFTTHKLFSYFTINSPVVFRLSMSRKMHDCLDMIDELVVEMNNFHFLQHAEAPSIVHPQTHSHVDELEVVGRQDEKERVVKILLDHSQENSNDNNVMVLPIVGMGGIGKTTLAQLVHNDQRVAHHFELVLWVCVSDKFIVKEIIQSIIQVETMKKCDLTEMEALQKELSVLLGKKRYLLVLDDVWNEDRHKWDDMRSLLCSNAGSGSAIIVTSRSDQVASVMGTLPTHQLSLLDEDKSWELFHRNTFGRGVEKQEELISVAKNIVHKCKGLPLAIKTMSALLCSKHHNQWVFVLDSDIWKDDILTTTGIVPALQLSYDHLSPEEKLCFSFCAIFSKDSLMDKDMLIQLWMANDFVSSETRGQHIFDVLVWRCFLQDVEIQKTPLSKFGDEFIQRTTCKMHDLMHDLADFVSGNDCFILEESSLYQEIMQESSLSQEIMQGSIDLSSLQHEVRHLSLDFASTHSIAAMKEILAPRPRTILIHEEWINPSTAESIFVSLRALKTTLIKAHMTNFKHLRYLDCSNSEMWALPDATSMLYSLQTLKLIGCFSLRRLPEGMRYMSSLRHIFLNRCNALEGMPPGFGQLTSLQTLTNYVIDSDAGCGIDQLKDLNLGAAFCLTELRKVHSAENAKEGNMSAKHNLKRLLLNWYGPSSKNIGYEVHSNAEGILEALCPHKSLEVLVISNYTGAKLSSWMHNSTLLENLGGLSLAGCNNCKDLPPLWQLPNLQFLSLKDLLSLTSIFVGNDETDIGQFCMSPPPFFPKLETMIVSNMPKLERWHQEMAGQAAVVSFPQLKKLEIYECPMLASMPERLPLLEDLLVKKAAKIPPYHLTNLSVQSNLECRCSMYALSLRWWVFEFESSRLGDSCLKLSLEGLNGNVECFEEELNRIPCKFIKELQMGNCDCLFSPEPSQTQQNIWNHFGFVQRMQISSNKSIVQWPAIEFRSLNHLRVLQMLSCSNLTGSLPSTISDDENVLPPLLQELEIIECENLVEAPKLSASLERLLIAGCPKMVSVPNFLGSVNNLRDLTLNYCGALRTFAEGMYGVTALRTLQMEGCPRVETLPEGLLQQLPALEKVHITRSCPNLEVALSRGGAYWNLVEAIPNRRVGPSWEEETPVVSSDSDSSLEEPEPRPFANCFACL